MQCHHDAGARLSDEGLECRPCQYRTKQIVSTTLTQFIEGLDGSAELTYRFYHDSHELFGHTVTLEWFQSIGRYVTIARISITPKSVTVQRDDNDHEGPDKSVIFARFPAELAPGTWHKVRMEMVGDSMVGQVDDLVAWGSSDLFKTAKLAPGFTVSGQSVDFRNLSIREATLNPEWESAKASLPKPGETVMPAAKGPAKGKGKAKKKAE